MVPVAGSDLFHSLDVDLPIGQGGLKISTFHDMSVFDVPWAFSRYRAAGERRLLSAALRKADVVIAVSDLHRRTNTRTERSACRCHAAGTRILGHDPHRSCSDRSSAAIETTGAIRAAGPERSNLEKMSLWSPKRARSCRFLFCWRAPARRAPTRPVPPEDWVTSRQKTFRHSIPPQLLSLTPPTTRGSVCRHSKPWRAARQWLRVRSEH